MEHHDPGRLTLICDNRRGITRNVYQELSSTQSHCVETRSRSVVMHTRWMKEGDTNTAVEKSGDSELVSTLARTS